MESLARKGLLDDLQVSADSLLNTQLRGMVMPAKLMLLESLVELHSRVAVSNVVEK